MISRTPFLTHIRVAGQYRYRDVLQIIPPNQDDPRPTSLLGWYGATLAVSFDERVAPERTNDNWAHDHRERMRIEFLASHVEAGKASQEWLNSATKIQATFYRRRAIEHEALRLLQVVTNNTFRRPSDSQHDWYLDTVTDKPVYGQGWYPSFATDQWGIFWTGHSEAIPLIDPAQHFERRGIDSENVVITLPSDIEKRLDDYFALPPQRKVTYARACELFANGQDIWPISKSLSLVSYVFAVDTLCHADDPRPPKCRDCGNLRSNETCSTCGGPRFGLTRRFREFVGRYIQESGESNFSEQLFSVRSAIAHRGELLRADEFDAGFNVGGTDDQSDLERGVGRTVRKVLLGWLSNARNADVTIG
jgi:hypothetical protein